jgi:hypothetical protein
MGAAVVGRWAVSMNSVKFSLQIDSYASNASIWGSAQLIRKTFDNCTGDVNLTDY